MNRTLIWACWRERLSRPLPLALLGMSAIVAFIDSYLKKSLSDTSPFFALVLGAGLVGRDVSSGALALLFSRPVKRSEYLLSRWLAGGLAAAALGVLLLLAQTLALRLRGLPISGRDLLFTSADGISGAFGLTACLVFFSTLVRGIGDLGLWFVASLLSVLVESAPRESAPGVRRVGEELHHLLAPQVDWARTLGSQPISWFEIVSYASSVTLFVALALVIINRKEISYASHA